MTALATLMVLLLLALRAGSVALRRRRHARRQAAAVPDLVDLFALAAAAGHPVWSCLRLVAPRAPAPVRSALDRAVHDLDHGAPLAVALGRLAEGLGPGGAELVDALGVAGRSGIPLVPVLDRVVEAARTTRRRQAEARARRLPVLLLLPLVGCILPAFALLAVAPLVLAALASLQR